MKNKYYFSLYQNVNKVGVSSKTSKEKGVIRFQDHEEAIVLIISLQERE